MSKTETTPEWLDRGTEKTVECRRLNSYVTKSYKEDWGQKWVTLPELGIMKRASKEHFQVKMLPEGARSTCNCCLKSSDWVHRHRVFDVCDDCWSNA